MNYTLHQLKIFLEIVKNQSITKASEELNLTQPAVSIQLKNFQDQFEIALTEVIGRKLYITDFGREIAEVAEKILNEAEIIQYKSMSHKGMLSGKLKISVVSTGKYVIPYFLTDFLKEHAGVNLILDVTNKSKVIESLEQNEIDFALVSVLPKHLDIKNIELIQNKLYVITNSEKEFKAKNYKNEIFEKIPLIYREKGSGTRFVMEDYIQRHSLPVRMKMELTSNEAVKQAVIAGLGSSIMPLIGIKNELQNRQLQIIPVKGFPIKSMWNLIWLKNKKFSPIASEYLSYLQKYKSTIIKERFEWYEGF
jgi:LysR family transcriptional regulator, low CO2-responsive transcriptional regulator